MFIFMFMASNALACSLETIAEAMAKQTISASFIQTKNIEVLSRPIHSTGRLWVKSKDLLVWQMLKPIKSTMVISQGEMQQFDKNDMVLAVPKNPLVNTLSSVFIHLLTGQLEQLSTHFNTDFKCNDESWTLKLVPFNKDIAQLFSLIQLQGKDKIEQVLLNEVRGDYTTIKLNYMTQELSYEFEKYFDKQN